MPLLYYDRYFWSAIFQDIMQHVRHNNKHDSSILLLSVYKVKCDESAKP